MSDLSELDVPKQDRPPELGDSTLLRWIPRCEKLYAVTNDGRVFSYHAKRPKMLKTPPNARGYSRFNACGLQAEDGKIQMKVHRVVARCFLGEPPEDRPHVLHINGRQQDNRVENLRYGTHADNMNDRKDHGTSNRGSRNGRARLSKEDVLEIRYRYQREDVTLQQLANEYGAHKATIGDITRGVYWSWVGGPTTDSNQNQKLSDADVCRIRHAYKTGSYTQTELADRFGVNQPQISVIVIGGQRSDCGGPIKGEDY